jgi:hypothetical protein
MVKENYTKAKELFEISLLSREIFPNALITWILPFLSASEMMLSEVESATRHLEEALQMASMDNDQMSQYWILPAVALLLVKKAEREKALEIYAFSLTHPFFKKNLLFHDVFGKPIGKAAADLPPDVVEATKERGRNRDLQTTVQELLMMLKAQIKEEGDNA